MAIEERMIQHLNQKCYRLYGSKLFEVNELGKHTLLDVIKMDQSLLDMFKKAVTDMLIQSSEEVIESVYTALIQKIYNARCNEFLRTTSKLVSIDKIVDGSVSLRDELKVIAIKQLSSSKESSSKEVQ